VAEMPFGGNPVPAQSGEGAQDWTLDAHAVASTNASVS
jgi:hypothetical protein